MLKRVLLGDLSIRYYSWNRWTHVWFHRKWDGKLLYLEISKFCICLDCRKNWIKDMVTGVVK